MQDNNTMSTNKQALSTNRHAIAIFTFVILLPLVYYIPPWLVHNVTDNHFFVTVLAVAIIVPIVSYVALPLLFKLFEMLNKK